MLCTSPRGSMGLDWEQSLLLWSRHREAEGTLWNAPAFPATTRRLSKLLVPESCLWEGRNRTLLKRQQSLLRSGMVMVSGVGMVPPRCSLLACPTPQRSAPSLWDEKCVSPVPDTGLPCLPACWATSAVWKSHPKGQLFVSLVSYEVGQYPLASVVALYKW